MIISSTEKARFASLHSISNGCWLWTGRLDADGYGAFGRGAKRRAHRVSYEIHRGEIPAGLTIDHLCRNRACVNPFHMEAVTHAENTMRGESPCARHARKTHCIHGHELSGSNLGRVAGDNRRVCKACDRRRHQRRAAA